MAMKKITRRWLVNGLGVIFVILLGVMIAFSFGVRSFYYSSVQQIIISRSSVISTLLQTYAQDSSVNFSQELQNIVETFEYRETMELMAIDSSGKVMMTSSGFLPEEDLPMPDFEGAMSSPDGIDVYQGRIGGENIMAVSVAAGSASENLAATRYVVSLEQVDNQILLLTAIIGSVCLAIILFVIFSSSYFINSIVNPVSEIAETARRIAQGDFKARLEKKNDDEIGELSDVINYMAEELANSEKLKNDFISSVSHELRTPLTAIRGWGETMLMDENIDHATLETGMGVIMRETERLSDMVEELLDFSRMQCRTHEAGQEQDGRAGGTPAKQSSCIPSVPSGRECSSSMTSPTCLCRYSVTGASCARCSSMSLTTPSNTPIPATPPRYRPGWRETISSSRWRTPAAVSVLPTFPRSRPNSTRPISPGVVRALAWLWRMKIIQMHGGRLDVSSVEGEGTTVTITLPIMERGDDSTQIAEATAEKAAPPSDAAVHLNKLDLSDIEDN